MTHKHRWGSARLYVALAVGWAVLSVAIAAWDWQGRWHAEGASAGYAFKLWLYWAQFSALPLLLAGALVSFQSRAGFSRRAFAGLLALGSALVIWSGVVEPNWLRVRNTTLEIKVASGPQPIKIAVISDLHWGLFVRDWQVRRVVDRLRALDADVLLVAGDWTYDPPLDLAAGLAPFGELNIPVYTVLGNHDLEKPGPKLAGPLRATLSALKIHAIEGQAVNIKGWQLVGLDDLWGGKPRAQIDRLLGQPHFARIVLTHQPDTLAMVPAGSLQLGVAGHTHGGQIQLPMLTRWVVRMTQRAPWIDGLYQTPVGNVFVTPGLGMIGLPWRFRVPSTIDLIVLQPAPRPVR